MEKIIVANLKKTYDKPRTKRRRVVVNVLKEIAARHAKSEYYNVKVDNTVMKEIYKHGGTSPLKKIKVKLTKDDKTNIVLVTLAEAPVKKEKQKEAKKETKKVPEKEKKKSTEETKQ